MRGEICRSQPAASGTLDPAERPGGPGGWPWVGHGQSKSRAPTAGSRGQPLLTPATDRETEAQRGDLTPDTARCPHASVLPCPPPSPEPGSKSSYSTAFLVGSGIYRTPPSLVTCVWLQVDPAGEDHRTRILWRGNGGMERVTDFLKFTHVVRKSVGDLSPGRQGPDPCPQSRASVSSPCQAPLTVHPLCQRHMGACSPSLAPGRTGHQPGRPR